jgi:hypothetical protein
MDKVSNTFLTFAIDGRYQTRLYKLEKDSVIDLCLESSSKIAIEDKDSDGNLFLIIFSLKDYYFGIGVDWNITGIKYEYLNNGIILIIDEKATDSINVNIAWKKLLDEKHLLDVWYGVDPDIR